MPTMLKKLSVSEPIFGRYFDRSNFVSIVSYNDTSPIKPWENVSNPSWLDPSTAIRAPRIYFPKDPVRGAGSPPSTK